MSGCEGGGEVTNQKNTTLTKKSDFTIGEMIYPGYTTLDNSEAIIP